MKRTDAPHGPNVSKPDELLPLSTVMSRAEMIDRLEAELVYMMELVERGEIRGRNAKKVARMLTLLRSNRRGAVACKEQAETGKSDGAGLSK